VAITFPGEKNKLFPLIVPT